MGLCTQVALTYGWWVLAAGRAIVMTVELWFVWQHITWMCEGEDDKAEKSKTENKTKVSASRSPSRKQK